MADFVEVHFDSAQDFVDALKIDQREWWLYHSVSESVDKEWERSWIFRGQSNADWALKPTAWRDKPDEYLTIAKHNFLKQGISINIFNAIKKYHKGVKPNTMEWNRMCEVSLQAFAESVLINEFGRMADRLGHSVPQIRDWPRRTGDFIDEYAKGLFKENSDRLWTLAIVALAQHHGVVTRLLDWSRNPIKATFFAALDAAENPDKSERFAVFALNQASLDWHIKMVELPYHENQFLQAQEGVFTFDSKGDTYYLQHGHYPSLEESVGLIPAMITEVAKPKKLTLPTSQAPEVLRRLWLQGHTKAHLMPTLDNVASALKMKWKYFTDMTL